MALVFGDSFDHYATADIDKKWTTASASAAIASPGLSPATSYLHIMNGVYIEKALATPLATFVAGFWFRVGSIGNARIIFAGIDSSAGTAIHVSLRTDVTGHMTMCRDATVLATSTNVFSANVWYHIEGKFTIDNSTGAYEVKVDGTSVNWIPSGTNKDTQNAGNATIGSYRLYGGSNSVAPGSHSFQHFYLLDTTGTQASTFLGPCRFTVLHPAMVGTTAEWAGNYADNFVNVADVLADGDTTFNQSSTAGQTDQFAMTAVPSGTIHAIQHVLFAKRDAGGARTIRPITRIGGTDYNGTTVTVAASYAFHTEPVMFSPATGGATAWDDAELNGAEMGYELVS